MRLRLYQIDAFTSRVFAGNPAAVCPLERWLEDGTLQAIAAENNLSETAFFVPEGRDYALRWFTPSIEVDLCGHATLASGFVVMRHLEPERSEVAFRTKSGRLAVWREGERFAMDFPALPPQPVDCPRRSWPGSGARPQRRWPRSITSPCSKGRARSPNLRPISRRSRGSTGAA